MLVTIVHYSQVPNKRVYLINEYRKKNSKKMLKEYRIKIPKFLNEYDLINEYEGKFHDYSK